MKKDLHFKRWIVRAEYSRQTEELQLEKMSNPLYVGRVRTPTDLNDMTIGQMVQISECKGDRTMFYIVCKVLLNMEQQQVDESPATDVVRFCGWVAGTIQRINELFDSVKTKPTKEEERAGIDKLKFGVFGLIDWYARRMGITDHEDVTNVTWGRVYQCLKMDNETNAFEKRLQKIYNDEYRK